MSSAQMSCVILLERGIREFVAKDVASAALHLCNAKEIVLERRNVSSLEVVSLVK